jgi:glycosyltransferase involved in cell wall biosynthesis
MKIGLVSAGYPPDSGGGIGTYSANLAESLVARGNSVFVLADWREGLPERETRNGVTVIRVKRSYLPLVESYLPGVAASYVVSNRLRELDREVDLDVIEFPNWEAPGLVYTKLPKRKPVVARAHTPFFETLTIDKTGQTPSWADRVVCWQEQVACLGADALVASTRFHANMIERHYGLPAGTIRILPLGLDIATLQTSISPRSPGPFRVLYVSRLEKRKGTQTLLDAVPSVLQSHPDTEFYFVGSDRKHADGGTTHEEYFRAKYPQCVNNVKFLGVVSAEDLTKWYQSADLFVVPSVYESFGLIYIEAMAAGLAVVGGRGGGIPEVIADGETGFLTEPNDVADVVRRVNQLIADGELRERMAKAGRARVEQRFSRELMAQNTEQVYRDAIAAHARKR